MLDDAWLLLWPPWSVSSFFVSSSSDSRRVWRDFAPGAGQTARSFPLILNPKLNIFIGRFCSTTETHRSIGFPRCSAPTVHPHSPQGGQQQNKQGISSKDKSQQHLQKHTLNSIDQPLSIKISLRSGSKSPCVALSCFDSHSRRISF